MNTALSMAASISLLLFLAPRSKSGPDNTATGTLVVVNQFEHSVSLVEIALRRRFATIPVGINGHEVAVSPDGHFLYVPIYGNSGVGKPGTDGASIDVIDIGKRQVSSSIQLGRPLRPHRAEFGPGGLLYVTGELANTIIVIDPATQKVAGEIPTGQPQSHMFVFSPDQKRLFTSNVGAGNISVLDVPGRRLVSVIPVAKTIQRISISPDGKHIFTHDQDSPRLAVIDISDTSSTAYKVSNWIDLPGVAYASEPTPDGKSLLAVIAKKHLLVAIDLATLKVTRSLDLPGTPSEILISPDGGTAFVSCMDTGKIAVIDVRGWKLLDPVVLSPGVDGLALIPAK